MKPLSSVNKGVEIQPVEICGSSSAGFFTATVHDDHGFKPSISRRFPCVASDYDIRYDVKPAGNECAS